MDQGPVPLILAAQQPQGFWSDPGPGYYPKYKGTVWQIICLAQLGADGSHPGVQAGCEYLLDNSRCSYDGFSMNGKPTGLIQCLQGNLCAALIDLGYLGDERLEAALDWMARSVTGQGIASAKEKKASVRYYRSGNSAPGFACSANNHLPCAWGAIKVMIALGKIPVDQRTPAMNAAIQTGIDFLLSRDPAIADYPMGYNTKPSLSWFRFGYPVVGYVTEVLQNLEVLTAFGYGNDTRLVPAIELVLDMQDSQGRWKMAYTYNGKTWADIEQKGKPSKWVTLRVMRLLKQISEQ
jgi:hypothetical protein